MGHGDDAVEENIPIPPVPGSLTHVDSSRNGREREPCCHQNIQGLSSFCQISFLRRKSLHLYDAAKMHAFAACLFTAGVRRRTSISSARSSARECPCPHHEFAATIGAGGATGAPRCPPRPPPRCPCAPPCAPLFWPGTGIGNCPQSVMTLMATTKAASARLVINLIPISFCRGRNSHKKAQKHKRSK